jgi:hypothetical protein
VPDFTRTLKFTVGWLFFFLMAPCSATQIRSDYFASPQKETSPYSKALARLRVLDKVSGSQQSPNNLTQPTSLREKIHNALGAQVTVDDESIQATVYLQKTRDGILRQHFYIRDRVLGDLRVLVLRPPASHSPSPVVLGLHGHGGSTTGFSRRFLVKQLLNRGWVVVLPSFRAMEGLRARFSPGEISESGKLIFNSANRGEHTHEKHIARELLHLGHPLMGFRVREARLALSLIRELPLVDSKNIFVLAHSGGSAVAELLLRFEPEIRGTVLDYFSPYKRSWDNYCCEGVPKLAPLAEQIHAGADLSIPVLKVKYNFPDPSRVLEFFKKHGFSSVQKSEAARPSIIYDKVEVQEHQIKTLFEKISQDSGPIEEILNLLPRYTSKERAQELAAKFIFTLLSMSAKDKAIRVIKALDIFKRETLESKVSKLLLESFSLLIAYGSKSEARVLIRTLPLLFQIRGWQGLAVKGFDQKLASIARDELSRILKKNNFHPLMKTGFQCSLASSVISTKSGPCADLAGELKEAHELNPSEAKTLVEILLRKELFFAHDHLIMALKNPYERVEFLLEVGLEHLPAGLLRDRYLNHLSPTLEMLEAPSHALDYLQMLINLLLSEESGPWFDLAIQFLGKMEDQRFRDSKVKPLVNLAVEYAQFSKAKKLLSFLESAKEKAHERQRINKNESRALAEQTQKARFEDEMRNLLQGISPQTDQPQSLQNYLKLEGKASQSGSTKLRKAILTQLFEAWKTFSLKASVSESFNLDFIERLLDLRQFQRAEECSKSLRLLSRIKAKILALAQRPTSQRTKFIHEIFTMLQGLKPSEEKARLLRKTWQLTPTEDFLFMRKRFLEEIQACIQIMSTQDLQDTGKRLLKTATEKGAGFEAHEIQKLIEEGEEGEEAMRTMESMGAIEW